MLRFIDTHAHLDGEEFKDDLPETIARAQEAGVGAILVPGIDHSSIASVMEVCRNYPGYCYPMVGLQPEEVKEDWADVLRFMREALDSNLQTEAASPLKYIAIGECGLDFYWSREFEKEQLVAFEEQVKWSVEYQLPLMIHCRKAQNEMLHVMKPYAKELPGGVFHCFTGNQKEAEAFLQMGRFCLGIGGVSTFKSSHLREDLPAAVPLDRIVLETDSPYMAPVPHRGKRNESAFVGLVLQTLAQSYGVTPQELATQTNANVKRLFGVEVG
ncbi:MAG: TatD family hydrolase [Prevotella sp.]|nr:TatD family hydrolase [Prevotella sp.]